MGPKLPSVPNGTAADAPIDVPAFPAVVGINFGNSYASIAVLTKEGQAECIANEDGERQIACAVSFHGEQLYIGNQAQQQLVKNSANTIVGFRDLLGKKFSEIPQPTRLTSAPVIEHPSLPDEPAYTVQVISSSPSPHPSSNPSALASALNSRLNSAAATPTATNPSTPVPATPASEPTPSALTLSVSEVTTLFLRSLIQSATDFLGHSPVGGAVFSVPPSFTPTQRAALKKAAEEAGVRVLQILDEAGSVGVVSALAPEVAESRLKADRIQLLVDLGQSSLSLALVAIREGLIHSLATSYHADIRGQSLDDALIGFFAKDFTKKTKVPLNVFSDAGAPVDAADLRADAKLRLAIEHTRRTLCSALSSASATCAVESLKDGMDYTGTINRMRFAVLGGPVYTRVAQAVKDLVGGTGIDMHEIDEVVFVGGAAGLPGLEDAVLEGAGLREEVVSSLTNAGSGAVGDATTVLARGCAAQAGLLVDIIDSTGGAAFGNGEINEVEELKKAFEAGSEWTQVRALAKSLYVYAPKAKANPTMGTDEEAAKQNDGFAIPILAKETPLPARRTIVADLIFENASETENIELQIWEVTEQVVVEKIATPGFGDDADEEEEEEEAFEEVKNIVIRKEAPVAILDLPGVLTKGKVQIQVQIEVGKNQSLKIDAWEVKKGGEKGISNGVLVDGI